MTKKFSIGGMSCSACVNGIEKGVLRLNGIEKAEVSLMAKSMTVTYDENQVSDQIIMATVEKLGYIACPFGEQAENDSTVKKMKQRFFISLALLVPLMYFAMGKMLNLPVFESKINLPIQAVIALAIMIINGKFFINGINAVKNLSPNMDTLVSMGSISAYIYSVVQMIMLYMGKSISHVFFEASAMVLVLVTLGKWLEEISKHKTGQEIEKLSKLIPKTVNVIKDGKEITILSSEIEIGDQVICKAGDHVAIDGVVIEGHATLDKSAITGESIPEEVSVNSIITSGSIVKSGYVIINAQKVKQDTLFAKIIEAVKNAGASKAPIQKLADKISAWFVPTVTLIAVITFLVWLLIIGSSAYQAFNFAISVLVVSCPCALGLATPVAVMAGTGKGASMGILFKDAECLQKAKDVNCVILDKTATLTQGKPQVTDYENLSDMQDQEIFSICYALEQKSNHPLAQAVMEYCKTSNHSVEDFEYEIGKGVKGYINGEKYSLGSFNVPQDLSDKYQGKSVIVLLKRYTLIAVFAIADVLKAESKDAVARLTQMGVKTVMLTGDNQSSASVIAKEVGITEFVAWVLPNQKLEVLKEYEKQGYKTAMVGDGINDSPALKGAYLGIAMGNGTDIAIDSADVVLEGGNLNGIANAIGLSKKANGIIKGNLFWAFIYNVLSIPIAAGVLSFVNVILTPIIASVAMCISSLFVVTNALRINLYKKQEIKVKEEKKSTITYKIQGMMCGHCEQKVLSAINSITGAFCQTVSHKKGIALVSGNHDKKDQIKSAIESAGFKVLEIL